MQVAVFITTLVFGLISLAVAADKTVEFKSKVAFICASIAFVVIALILAVRS